MDLFEKAVRESDLCSHWVMYCEINYAFGIWIDVNRTWNLTRLMLIRERFDTFSYNALLPNRCCTYATNSLTCIIHNIPIFSPFSVALFLFSCVLQPLRSIELVSFHCSRISIPPFTSHFRKLFISKRATFPSNCYSLNPSHHLREQFTVKYYCMFIVRIPSSTFTHLSNRSWCLRILKAIFVTFLLFV